MNPLNYLGGWWQNIYLPDSRTCDDDYTTSCELRSVFQVARCNFSISACCNLVEVLFRLICSRLLSDKFGTGFAL